MATSRFFCPLSTFAPSVFLCMASLPSQLRASSWIWLQSAPGARRELSNAGADKDRDGKIVCCHPNSGSHDRELKPNVIEFSDSLQNFEKVALPRGAGTDTPEGFDLGRMRRLVSRMGDPLSQYPVVHVAGTKGKGSTVAFISNILRAEGYSVGSYTSPHVRSIRERIVAGKTEMSISSDSLQKLFEDTWEAIQCAVTDEHGCLTHFEVLTALAFKHFARENVDIAIIEAGLGGIRDATNIIQPSGLAVAVITNVGEEHLSALGGTLESIALAKSGIIKQGRPVVIGGPLDPGIEKIIQEVAALKNARVVPAFGPGVDCSVNNVQVDGGGPVQFCGIRVDRNLKVVKQGLTVWKIENSFLRLRLIGYHQLNNVATAICTVLCLRDQGWRIHDSAIWSGLENTVIPGRFYFVTNVEAIRLGCKHSSLILDGAHTAGSAKALAETLRMVFPKVPLALVVAMASDKDHHGFTSQLLSGAMPNVVVTTEVPVAGSSIRATSASFLAKVWSQVAKGYNLEVLNDYHLKEPGCSGFSPQNMDPGQQDMDSLDSNMLEMEKMNPQPEHRIVISESASIQTALKKAIRHLESVSDTKGVVCVTGSLHAISAVLSL